jgi:hypothetical protein
MIPLNDDEFKLFDDSQYEGTMPPPPPFTTEGGRTIDLRRRQASFVTPDADWHRRSDRRKAGYPDEQSDIPATEGMRRVVHVSKSVIAPHDIDHPNIEHHRSASQLPNLSDGQKDTLNFANDVVFLGDEDNEGHLRSGLGSGRDYTHIYEMPDNLTSTERFGDDNSQLLNLYARSDQPELWEGTPAKRQDAVERNQVIRFTNAVEGVGSQSFIAPKSLIHSGDIKYLGRKHFQYGKYSDLIPPNSPTAQQEPEVSLDPTANAPKQRFVPKSPERRA